MKEKEKKGYIITTYKIRLYTKHLDWIEETKKIYNAVLRFYYNLLFDKKELLELQNQELMRRLEQLTIGEKKRNIPPSVPIPYKKIPLYFRRAAINSAIGLIRSQETRVQSVNQKLSKIENFNASPIYYKGMYKDFETSTILLKLFTGTSWVWVKYRFNSMGRKFPEHAVILSPTLKLQKKRALLHIPVMLQVGDIRTVKSRIEEKEKYCTITFPSNSSLAVCILFDSDGRFCHAYFVKGGKELKHRRKFYQKIMKNGAGKKRKWAKEKIHHLTDYYAHKVSREIVSYCKRNQVKIIVVPNYKNEIDFSSKRFMKATRYDWIGRRIIQYLNYKAFKEGIVTTAVKPHFSSRNCYQCKKEIKRYNSGYFPNKNYYGGKLFLCESGHKGNTAYNTARNLGNYFYERYIGAKQLSVSICDCLL